MSNLRNLEDKGASGAQGVNLRIISESDNKGPTSGTPSKSMFENSQEMLVMAIVVVVGLSFLTKHTGVPGQYAPTATTALGSVGTLVGTMAQWGMYLLATPGLLIIAFLCRYEFFAQNFPLGWIGWLVGSRPLQKRLSIGGWLQYAREANESMKKVLEREKLWRENPEAARGLETVERITASEVLENVSTNRADLTKASERLKVQFKNVSEDQMETLLKYMQTEGPFEKDNELIKKLKLKPKDIASLNEIGASMAKMDASIQLRQLNLLFEETETPGSSFYVETRGSDTEMKRLKVLHIFKDDLGVDKIQFANKFASFNALKQIESQFENTKITYPNIHSFFQLSDIEQAQRLEGINLDENFSVKEKSEKIKTIKKTGTHFKNAAEKDIRTSKTFQNLIRRI